MQKESGRLQKKQPPAEMLRGIYWENPSLPQAEQPGRQHDGRECEERELPNLR
jgi:hypothetical protein